MRHYLSAILAAAALATGSAATAVAAPTLETYGRLPSLEQVVVSPDGTKLAYVRPRGAGRSILVQDLATQKILAGVDLGEKKLRDVAWVGSGHLVITTSQTAIPTGENLIFYYKQETLQARIYDIAKREFHEVLGKEGGTSNYIFGLPSVRSVDGVPNVFVEGMRIVGGESFETVFRIDPNTNMTRAVEQGTRLDASTSWILDEAGAAVAKTEYESRSGAWRLMTKPDGRWRAVVTGTYATAPPRLIGLAPEPGYAVLAVRGEDDEIEYQRVKLFDGSTGEKLAVPPEASFLTDATTRRLIGYVEGETRKAKFLDPKDQAAWDRLTRAFPGELVSLESWSDDRKAVVVRVQGKNTGNAYALVDLKAGSASIVDDVYAGVGPAEIAAAKWFDYKAADGASIQAVLTLPNGKDAKALPLVVLPHGGPEAHDDLSFDWWSQALAARGYAVLQPNFRGSTGYGLAFTEAGHGEWGRKMQSDVSDGVRKLIADGVVDPKRVCIVGASYGGYAALAGVTLEQGLYRCAVSVSGVSDLRRMLVWLRSRGGGEYSSLRYWRKFMGVERTGEEALDQYSPVKLATVADAPILLIHGKDDTVVAYEQSRVMAEALQQAGKPVEFVTLAGEDHWLSSSDTRLQMLQTTVKFLEAHNPPS